MSKKVILLMITCILVVGMILKISAAGQPEWKGKLMQVKSIWFLKTTEDIFALDIDKLSESNENMNLEKGSIITVSGEIADDIITVNNLQTENESYTLKESVATVEDYQGYRIDPQKCISCRLCIKNCPVGAIEMINGKAVIDADKCIQCGICKNGNGQNWKGCPVGAINN